MQKLKVWLCGGLMSAMYEPKMQADLKVNLIAGQIMILRELQMS